VMFPQQTTSDDNKSGESNHSRTLRDVCLLGSSIAGVCQKGCFFFLLDLRITCSLKGVNGIDFNILMDEFGMPDRLSISLLFSCLPSLSDVQFCGSLFSPLEAAQKTLEIAANNDALTRQFCYNVLMHFTSFVVFHMVVQRYMRRLDADR
jgi:hypothetical protein